MSDPKSEMDDERSQTSPAEPSGPRAASEAPPADVGYRPPMPTPRGGVSGPPRAPSAAPPAPSKPPRPGPTTDARPNAFSSGPPRPGTEPPPGSPPPSSPPPSSPPPGSPPPTAVGLAADRATPIDQDLRATNPTSPRHLAADDEGSQDDEPVPKDIPPPIRAMRRVAIGQPPPNIEASETTLEELSEDLNFGSEAELSENDLMDRFSEEPPDVVPAPDLREEAPPDSEEAFEVETIETVEQVAPPAPVPPSAAPKPPPPKRSQKPSLPKVKARRKPWWETLFGDDFSRAHRPPSSSQMRREVDFICKTLGLSRGAVVLDLGCGQGEHAVELSERGISVVGYDLSVFQLAMAGDRAQAARQKINFLQGDMREMAFDGMFDSLLCWGTTFGFFEEEKNVDVARRMYRALKPGGSLMLEIMNRDFAAQEAPTNVWFEGDGCVCMDDVELDWITSRLKVKRSIILDDGRSKELHYSIRLYGLTEIGKLLHEVGFRVVAVSGDVSTPGAYFGPASPRIIIAAQRP